MFHIKEVLQVRMVMMAVISNTLHDQGHVNSLCDALDDAFDKLYPVSSKHQAAKKA